jgi:hypothetical protein
MPGYDEIAKLAKELSALERERLAREIAPPSTVPILAPLGTLAQRPPAPHSVAWLKAERGHAVLATDTGPEEADIPGGPHAIAGMWADMAGGKDA